MIASQHPQDVKMPFTSPSDQSADTPGVPSKEIPVSDPVSENATSNQTLLLGHQGFRQRLLTGLGYKDSMVDWDLEAKLRTIWTLPRQDEDLVVAIIQQHNFHA